MNYKRTGSSKQRTQRWACVVVVAYLLFLVIPEIMPGAASALIESNVASSPTAQSTPQPALATPFVMPQQLRFRHLTVDEGLSSQRVTVAIQDSDGFMWFATTNGLDRYDGYQIIAYRNNPTDPQSLSGNFINDLIQDHTGTLWVGTNTGLNSFDRGTGRFTRYQNDPNDPNSLSGNTVNDVFEDKSGVIWVGTTSGLNSIDRATGRFTHYLNDPKDPQSISGNNALVTYEDKSGVLWVGTGTGLNRLDRATGHFTRYQNDPNNPHSLSNNSVWDIHEDRMGVLWMTTDGGGLNSLDRATGTFDQLRHDPKDSHSLSFDRLDCIYEDPSGALWIGTFGGGISVLDPTRHSFNVYQNDPADPSSLSNNSVTYIYASQSGLLWLGTIGGGVEIYNPQQLAFTVYKHGLQSTASLAGDNINAVYEDRNGDVWAGTRDAGLDRLVPGEGADGQVRSGSVDFVHYPPDPANSQALGFPYVRALLQDHKGIMWVGTYGGGLYRLDPATGIFTPYTYGKDNPNSLVNNTINQMVEDNDANIWIATFGGLSRFDPERNIFTSYLNDPSNPNSISSNAVWAVTKDRDGNIWIGTRAAGLNRIEPATGKVTRYRHDQNNPSSLSDDGVDDVLVDRAGVLWVGMFGGGLDRFNPADGTFTHYRERAGLASDEVLSLIEDGTPGAAGNIWVVTGHALSRLGQDRKTIRTYDVNDGLPSTQYTFASYATQGGELLIGSEHGLIAFNPAELRDFTIPPPVAFTDFLLGNKPVPITPDSVLPKGINQTDTIRLSYSDRVISFEFAALSFRAPARNRYRYKLEGFDPDWTEVDSTRRLVTYTNLNPGEYTLRVTAANADGVWNDTGRAVNLIIAPPWWEMIWFRALSVLVVMGLAFGLYRWRVGSLEKQRSVLEAGIATRTAALAQSNTSLQAEIVDRKEAEAALQYTNLQLNKRVTELSALNQIAQTLTQWVDLNASLQSIGSTISGLFNGAAIGIWVLDDSRLSISRLLTVVQGETLIDDDSVQLSDTPLITQVVSRAQTRVLVPSSPQPVIAQPPHLPVDESAGGTMLLPMQSRNEVIGLLCIRAISPEQVFTPADVALAQTIAGTLANAIENARLFAQAQLDAAEDERKRLAHELHDSVSQALFVANLTADVLPSIWELNPEQGKQALGDMQKFTRSAVAEMRMLLVELRPKALANTPLHDLLQTLSTATATKSHAAVETHLDYAPHLSSEVQIALYRLAQEALNNVFKHAKAHQITVILDVTPEYTNRDGYEPWNGTITLQIIDDGRGFDPAAASKGRLGLEAMRERAAGINARLNIVSGAGEGTQVVVTWTGHNVPVEVEA